MEFNERSRGIVFQTVIAVKETIWKLIPTDKHRASGRTLAQTFHACSSVGDVPSATAILDRFLHRSELFEITGRSYRLYDRGNHSKVAKAPTGSGDDNNTQTKPSKGAKA